MRPSVPIAFMLALAFGGASAQLPTSQSAQDMPAAEDWRLPSRYVTELRRLAPGYRGARPAETGEIG